MSSAQVSAPCNGGNGRSFRFHEMDWVGLDLDHTLIQYKLEAVESLVFEVSVKFLVHRRDYPRKLLDLSFDCAFALKGLVIDKSQGNLLKLDAEAKVERAMHGFRVLTREEITHLYGNKKLEGFWGASTQRFFPLTSYFERPMGFLVCSLVDMGLYNDGDSVTRDLLDSLYSNFSSWDGGSYFPALREDPLKYVHKLPAVRKWLLNLRKKGIHTFLLSNSLADYVNLLCNASLGEDWTSLFDVVIVHARKPTFFDKNEPFYSVTFSENGQSVVSSTPATSLSMGHVYSGGNVDFLVRFFESVRAVEHGAGHRVEICYCGDHLVSDILVVREMMQWHVVAIVEEVSELHDPKEDKGTQMWGSFFVTEHGFPSFWQRILAEHATLCVSSVSNLAAYPVDHVFESHEGAALWLPVSGLQNGRQTE